MTKRTLIIVSIFPPTVSGSAIMMGNLLRHFPQESLLVIASRSRGYPIDRSTDIPCAKYYIDLPAWADRHRTKYFLMPAIVHKALKIASENNIDHIFTYWPDTHFVIAAYFAAKLLKKPLYLWLHSLWEERNLPIHDYVMTRLFEKRIINYAHHLFVATEAEQAFYFQKYGLNSTVLYASVDFSLDGYRKIADTSSAVKKEKTIMFVGAIYPPMNLDSIQRLKKAVDSIDTPKIRLLLCTPIEKEQLKAWGLIGPNVEVKFAPKPDLMNLLDKADILFLPLAFNSDMPLEIQTVFPTKTLEYLLSKVPILVHAPPGSYISNYASVRGFGYVIDKPDVNLLREGILELLENQVLRSSLPEKARQTAKERDSRKIANILRGFLLE